MSAVSLNREVFGALVEELALVVGAMIDAAPNVVAGTAPAGRQWLAVIQAEATGAPVLGELLAWTPSGRLALAAPRNTLRSIPHRRQDNP